MLYGPSRYKEEDYPTQKRMLEVNFGQKSGEHSSWREHIEHENMKTIKMIMMTTMVNFYMPLNFI